MNILKNLKSILNMRNLRYGAYHENALISYSLKREFEKCLNDKNIILNHYEYETVHHIFSKLSRVLTKDFLHIDSYVDMLGYTRLTLNQLEKIMDSLTPQTKAESSNFKIVEPSKIDFVEILIKSNNYKELNDYYSRQIQLLLTSIYKLNKNDVVLRFILWKDIEDILIKMNEHVFEEVSPFQLKNSILEKIFPYFKYTYVKTKNWIMSFFN